MSPQQPTWKQEARQEAPAAEKPAEGATPEAAKPEGENQ
jgi:hypothetical protein